MGEERPASALRVAQGKKDGPYTRSSDQRPVTSDQVEKAVAVGWRLVAGGERGRPEHCMLRRRDIEWWQDRKSNRKSNQKLGLC